MVPVLDTHAWVLWVSNDKRLGKSVIAALDDLPPDQRPWLSDISLREVATLVEKGRLGFNLPFGDWLEALPTPAQFESCLSPPTLQRKSPRFRNHSIVTLQTG